MDDRANTNDVGTDAQTWLGHVPKVSDALKKGVAVAVATWGGRDLTGTICDWDQPGMLLDVSEPEDGSDGLVFIPWSSIERVNIGAVTPRRVKVLHR